MTRLVLSPEIRGCSPVRSERNFLILREELVQDLLATGYIHSCHDFCRVAAFLQCGLNGDVILVMEELKRWPDAYVWLRGRLENEQRKNGGHVQKRILIAEDDGTTNEILSSIALRLGYDVASVNNGEQMLAALAKEKFAAVITEIAMPLLTGLAVAELSRSQGDPTPFIALTAMSKSELGADVELFTHVFYKPCDVRALFRYVHTLISVQWHSVPNSVRL
jgi:CheY-like chemotaxis protein